MLLGEVIRALAVCLLESYIAQSEQQLYRGCCATALVVRCVLVRRAPQVEAVAVAVPHLVVWCTLVRRAPQSAVAVELSFKERVRVIIYTAPKKMDPLPFRNGRSRASTNYPAADPNRTRRKKPGPATFQFF